MKIKVLHCLFLFCLAGCSGQPLSVKTGLEGKPMPSINLLLMDSLTRLNTSSIPSGKPIVLILFSPYCPYCQAQTREIIDKIKSLDNIRFYFLSDFPFEEIKKYYNRYQLNKYSNLTVAQDNEGYSENYFKANAVPYVAIYSKERLLKQVLIGNVEARVIKDIAFK